MIPKHRYPYTPQVDSADCGVAALSMILKKYHSQIPLARLRLLAGTDLEGTTALGIVKTAQSLGFSTHALKADMGLFDEKNLLFPFIVNVVTEEGFTHYYVVENADKNSITIADPDPQVKIVKMSRERFACQWTGVTLFIAPSPEYKPSKEKADSLWAFVPLLVKQKKLIMNIIIASLLVTIINIVGAYYLQTIIDTYIPNALMSTLGIISIALIATYTIQQILQFAQNFLLNVLGQRLVIDISLSYIRHIFQLPMSFFSTRRTGEITSRFSDANTIISALASSVMSLFLDLTVLVITGAVLGFQNVQLFLLILVSIPLYVVIVLSFVKIFEKQNSDTMQSNAVVSSSIIEDISGIETVKALASEETRYQRIDREFTDFLKKAFKLQKNAVLQNVLEIAVQLILSVAVLWVGADMVMKQQITLGQLITFNALLTYFTNPLTNIISLQTKLQQARVANNRLNEVFLVEGEFGDKTDAEDIDRMAVFSNGDIAFSDVSYRYGFSKNTLSHINLSIHQGEKVVVVGMSGSGKTTLMKLLVDFFTPTEGEITVGNIGTVNVDKHILRRNINYLPQEPFIFTGTVRENLTMGCNSNISQAEIEHAADLAEVRSDIERLDLGYDTQLSSEATGLSEGQKQRLALARALLSPAKILILDEATSSQDVLTEKKILRNLFALDRTIIFIAHRLSVAQMSEHIVVIDKGQIVEEGSHQELMAQNGFYAHLHED